MLSMIGQMLGGGAAPQTAASLVANPTPAAGTGGEPGFPVFSPQAPSAQGFQGAGASQQNPNEGGASSTPSSITAPSTRQGGGGSEAM